MPKFPELLRPQLMALLELVENARHLHVEGEPMTAIYDSAVGVRIETRNGSFLFSRDLDTIRSICATDYVKLIEDHRSKGSADPELVRFSLLALASERYDYEHSPRLKQRMWDLLDTVAPEVKSNVIRLLVLGTYTLLVSFATIWLQKCGVISTP